MAEIQTSLVHHLRLLHEPIGALVLEFAELESRTTEAIDLLFRLSHREGVILEASMPNFYARIELFHALAILHHKNELLTKEVEKIVHALKNANDKRNNFVHNEWTSVSVSSGGFGKVRNKISGGQIRQLAGFTDVRADDIWDAVDEVYGVKVRIERWLTCFRTANPERWPAAQPSNYRPKSPRREMAEGKL